MIKLDETCGDKVCKFAALKDNCIILGSNCTNRCKFCYNNQLPPNIKVGFLRQRSLEEVKKCVRILDRESRFVKIYEPFRIVPSDPLNYPGIRELLEYIREWCPKARILVPNSSGIAIDKSMLSTFSKVKNIALDISLVSTQKYNRHWMTSDSARVRQIVKWVSNTPGVTAAFTIIAMAQFLPWKDISETILYLDKFNPKAVTIFTYSYTDRSRFKPKMKDINLFNEFCSFIDSFRGRVNSEILLFPITRNQPPVVHGLFDNYFEEVSKVQKVHRNKKILALVSEAIFEVAHERLKRFENIKVKAVKNITFGGNIVVGGLLTNSDYIKAAKGQKCDLIMISGRAYTREGLDLCGKHFESISKALRKPVKVINPPEKWQQDLSDYAACQN